LLFYIWIKKTNKKIEHLCNKNKIPLYIGQSFSEYKENQIKEIIEKSIEKISYEEAEEILLKAYDNLSIKKGENDRMTLSVLKMLITNYEAWGKIDKAKELSAKLKSGRDETLIHLPK